MSVPNFHCYGLMKSNVRSYCVKENGNCSHAACDWNMRIERLRCQVKKIIPNFIVRRGNLAVGLPSDSGIGVQILSITVIKAI